MHRFFATVDNINDGIIIKDKSEIHHLKNVLRLKKDDEVVVFDGKGKEYQARIKSLSELGVEFAVINRKQNKRQKSLEIVLACALPKKFKFDLVVEKATELGVDRIIPLKTSRTIVDLKGGRAEKKINRWQQIAINASKQCQRTTVPRIEGVTLFNQAVGEIKKYHLALIPCLAGKRKKIEEVLMGFKGKSIIVFIGPEGDFTPQEVQLAVKSGCQPVTLGNRVLKVDSAAFYTLSVVNFIFQLKQ